MSILAVKVRYAERMALLSKGTVNMNENSLEICEICEKMRNLNF